MKWLLLVSLFLAQPSVAVQTGGAVTGEIRLADGKSAGGVRVSAMAVSNLSSGANGIIVLDRITQADNAGRYLLSDIPPGRYYILAGSLEAPTYYPGTNGAAGARILTIEAGSTTNAVDFKIPRLPAEQDQNVIRLVVPTLIGGRVVTENGRPLPQFLPTLYIFAENGTRTTIRGADGWKIRGSGTFGAIPVSKDGSFRFPLEDGEYTIALITATGEPLSDADGYYVKSIFSGSSDLLKGKLRVQASAAPPITITLAAGSKSGK